MGARRREEGEGGWEEVGVVGEDMCVLEKHATSSDVCQLRVLVSERLSVAAEWIRSPFQTEMETLETQLEKQNNSKYGYSTAASGGGGEGGARRQVAGEGGWAGECRPVPG